MGRLVTLNLDPETASDEAEVRRISASLSGLKISDITFLRIIKRSVDARGKKIRIILSVELLTGDAPELPVIAPYQPAGLKGGREAIIIGAGPAGLFAALRLLEHGIRPIIIERGTDVSSRKRDIAKISREHKIDPDSNYCFGEGGAGTYSDGKLYTRSRKRGDNSRVLELLYLHGASPNILYEAHPHLGSDKLPRIISSVRDTILEAGGQIMFGKRVTDLLVNGDTIKGVTVAGNENFYSSRVILATGHSARDIYGICINRGIELEMKSFALGVRVEHPQELIDRIQYHGTSRGKYLPAASYTLVRQVEGRGVYSFCMCPGGFIVPAATSQEEIVVNGMSPSDRNSPFANSGIVTEIRPGDLEKYSRAGVLAGIEFQKDMERKAWEGGGMRQSAPAQRLSDFVDGKVSQSLPAVSYFPGVTSSPVHSWLSAPVVRRLKEGFRMFGRTMHGFLTNEAVILAVESRTSSPVRIPRDRDKMNHIRISGLFPCGEGSGYSGGIVSSAVDGMNAADAIAAAMGN